MFKLITETRGKQMTNFKSLFFCIDSFCPSVHSSHNNYIKIVGIKKKRKPVHCLSPAAVNGMSAIIQDCLDSHNYAKPGSSLTFPYNPQKARRFSRLLLLGAFQLRQFLLLSMDLSLTGIIRHHCVQPGLLWKFLSLSVFSVLCFL